MKGWRSAATAALGAAVFLVAGARLSACPICFRIEDGAVSAGVIAAVFTLMGVTAVVLVAVARFAMRFKAEE